MGESVIRRNPYIGEISRIGGLCGQGSVICRNRHDIGLMLIEEAQLHAGKCPKWSS